MRVFKFGSVSTSKDVRSKVEAFAESTVGYSIDAVPGGVDPFA